MVLPRFTANNDIVFFYPLSILKILVKRRNSIFCSHISGKNTSLILHKRSTYNYIHVLHVKVNSIILFRYLFTKTFLKFDQKIYLHIPHRTMDFLN